MKVLHIIETIDPASGGTTSAFLGILGALASVGDVEVHAATHLPEGKSGAPEAIRDVLTLTGPAGRVRTGSLGGDASRVIERISPDLVHLHGLWSADLIAAAKAARGAGARTLWQPHGMLVKRAYAHGGLKKSVFLRLLGLGRELREASGIVYASEFEHAESAWLGATRATAAQLVPLPVEIPIDESEVPSRRAVFRDAHGLGEEARAVLFLGRLHPVKRVDLAIRAFAHVADNTSDAQLLLAGGGDEEYEKSLRDLVRQLDLTERVTFLGWMPPETRWDALCGVDCLTLCSMFENFGFVVPEALGVGTPVAITDQLAMSGGVHTQQIGRISAADPLELAGAIQGVLEMEDREGVSARARSWVRESFSPAAVSGRLLDVYRQTLEGGSA